MTELRDLGDAMLILIQYKVIIRLMPRWFKRDYFSLIIYCSANMVCS
jgi:hypothetical protein